MKTFRYPPMFVIITICLFSIQLLFANDPNSSDQSNEKTGTFITNFGGGLAFGGDTNLYVLLSELGVVKKLSDRYSFGYVFHSELDFADNNRFGFNLLLRRKLNNQKSYDVGIGFTIYQIGGREKSPTVTTFFNYNFLPDIAISTRLTIPRIEQIAIEPFGDSQRLVSKGYKPKPVIYVGLLARSKTGKYLNLVAIATATVLGLLYFSVDGD